MPSVINVITALPATPSRSRPGDFSDEADAFLGAIPLFRSEANALATELLGYNTQSLGYKNEAYDYRVVAQEARAVCLANANFKGRWANLTGALNIPASVSHNDELWLLLNNLPNVAASEPSLGNTAWKYMGIWGVDGGEF